MSKKRGTEVSLSEKLSSLIQTKPSAVESDDDDLMTVDKIVSNENDSEYSADELDISKFRTLNNGLLEEDDKKYSGKGISRNDFDDSFSNSYAGNVDDESDDSSAKSDFDHEVEENVSKTESEDESQSSETAKDVIKSNKSEQEENFNKEIFLKAASDIEKGKAIRNQLQIWDFLLECRMKFQKCLMASNEFPNYKNFPKFKSKGNPLFQDLVEECKKSLQHLLNSLMTLQNVFLKTNVDFSSSRNSEEKEVKDYDDEVITSDSENDDIQIKKTSTSAEKLKKLSDFSTEINRRHMEFQNYRNNTIQKWNDKTRVGYISNKNFSAFEQSTLKQIELVLLDKQRLIKKTQTKRSSYHILGEDDKEPPFKKPAIQSEDLLNKSLDIKSTGLHKEIFDDDDFYHQLLSEMVKRKANDVMDPVQLGRQWMQLQKIRSKMRKAVDTKASKGRKVRFVVHPKLVNFMMPIHTSNYNEESKTELFNSLFGKTKK